MSSPVNDNRIQFRENKTLLTAYTNLITRVQDPLIPINLNDLSIEKLYRILAREHFPTLKTMKTYELAQWLRTKLDLDTRLMRKTGLKNPTLYLGKHAIAVKDVID